MCPIPHTSAYRPESKLFKTDGDWRTMLRSLWSFLVITWLLVPSCWDTSSVEVCKWWSSVLRSLVDLVKSSVDSENPSRRWRRGVEQWLEPQNKYFVFAIAFVLALYCSLLLACVIAYITYDISCVHFIIASNSFLANLSINSHTTRLQYAPLTLI